MEQKLFEEKYGVERLNTHCTKWDGLKEKFGEDGLISMWVADMDFKAPEQVIEALQKRIEHGVFGYSLISNSYYDSFINWEEKRHGYKVKKEWIRYTPGVVSGIYWIVNIFTKPGDAILVSMPVYYPFHNSVKENGRKLVHSNLINNNGRYEFDYEDFENKIVENDVKIYILCSPHNPVGRVWKEEELDKIMEICQKYNVLVISDEIHHDLILEGKHIPTAIVNNGKYAKNIITLTAPSKTFNLAGCKNSFVIIENEDILKKFDTYANTVARVSNGNLFGYVAAEAAYTYGEEWLSGAIATIKGNYEYMVKELAEKLPQVKVTPLEGTYLSWLDFNACLKDEELEEIIQNKCKIAVDYGRWFGEAGKGFIRINLATPRKYVEEAVKNLIDVLNK
ncbi:MAG: MalY/PatB family protein [Fusobacterium sp.]|uniref:MalY/PatB family protein n=1 Tax=Fusobacterium sp. TaxID=68766 RepID=UPI002A754DC1|nr:MalY/PatB family protein [Fusobacterium sp.]MDY3060747.1 MalY/PatB family protein [Fusobacterium sp.]